MNKYKLPQYFQQFTVCLHWDSKLIVQPSEHNYQSPFLPCYGNILWWCDVLKLYSWTYRKWAFHFFLNLLKMGISFLSFHVLYLFFSYDQCISLVHRKYLDSSYMQITMNFWQSKPSLQCKQAMIKEDRPG